jgi:2-polyprenyl-6-hydroxyphenyl methylase/3-demethylubiquinone-9 3-methyltransferase
MQKVNNDIYNELGERWYCAHDDPVALLRAESKLRNPWVLEKLKLIFGEQKNLRILDVGCGGGFLSNYLSANGYRVSGIDLSQESLEVAKKYDKTHKVQYQLADAQSMPFADASFDVITAMDFLEHVENPSLIIKEISRVLKPGGSFFFHTFNRNLLSWFVIIKLVEIFVKNTPPHMHVLHLFIKPEELKNYCAQADLQTKEFIGYKPNLLSIKTLRSFLSGVVPEDFSFRFTKSLLTSYSGYAVKMLPKV